MTIDKLVFNNDSENFEANTFLGDKSYTLVLCDFTQDEERNATVLANEISNWMDTNINPTKQYAATELLQLKNESWLEEDEVPLTESEFIENINIESILAFSNKSFKIFFTDNDIFWGHAIAVAIDRDLNFNGVNIAG